MTTIRLLLIIESSKNLYLNQLDINTNFLHGDLEEEIYMKCPPGLNFFHKNPVCKLIKSIYGLKQESRQGNNKLNQSLSKLGFQRSISYDSLFTKNNINYFTIILVYVDDLILTGNNIKEITYTKQFLDIKFSIKDLGHLKYFLEFEIAKFSQDISLCQRKYTLDLLQKNRDSSTQTIHNTYGSYIQIAE